MGKPQAVAPAADPTAAWRQALVRVADLKPSPTNPRTTFDPAELAELAENVRRYGVLQPLLVRPVPIPGHPAPRFDGPRWDGKLIGLDLEVVAGERRRRAALAAGLAEVPVVVRLLTDEEVLAIQLTEIDQSVGIKVSERVRAYGRLAGTGKTAEEIAATVERPVKFVRGLLRMARLPAWALAAVDRGILPRGTAELVARVPGEEGRKRAAGCVLLGVTDPKDLDAEEWNDGDTWEEACEGIALGGPPAGVLSSRDAEALIRTHFTRELKTAPFSRKSLDLLPAAGSCDACPKRAGNDPEAAAEGTRADTCLDPDCYRKKVEAHDETERAKFRRKCKLADGDDVNPDGAALAGERPARGWCDWNGTVGGSEIAADLVGYPKLMTRKVSEVVLECPVVHGCRLNLVLDDRHKPHVLVKTADARKTLTAAGVLRKPDARPAAKKPAAGKKVPLRDDETFDPAPLAAGSGAGTTPAAPDEGDVADRAVTTAVRILGEFTEMNADDLKLIYGVTGEDFHCSAVFEALHLIARFLIRDHAQFGPERERFLKDALGCGATGSTPSRVLAYEAVVGAFSPEKLLGFCVRAAAGPVLEGEFAADKGLAKDLLDWAELDREQLLDQARRELAGGETADEKLAKAEAAAGAVPPPAPTTTPLARIDGIPDAVLDLLMGPDATGKLTLERVLTDCEAATAGIDLPLRNKLVTYFVTLGAKLKPAEHAAEAIAAAVREGGEPAEPDEPQTKPAASEPEPSLTPAKGEPVGPLGQTPAKLNEANAAADLKGLSGMTCPKPPRVRHVLLNDRPHLVVGTAEGFDRGGPTGTRVWDVRPLWSADVARNRGVAPTHADPLEGLRVEVRETMAGATLWREYVVGAKREARRLIHVPAAKKSPAKGKGKKVAK